METILAKHSGFCEGVERAYRIALDTLKTGKPVFMLGNLVHNKQVVEKFKGQGVRPVSGISEIPHESGGTLLISAHGVPPEIYREAEAKGLVIVDTTCPWVKRAQKIAKETADNGCEVVIVGDKGHAEVRGLVGWSGGSAKVIEDIEDIKDIKGDKCVGILAQTTQSEGHFKELALAVKGKFKDVRVHNTICGATQKRQSAAIEIAKQADIMLVVGDRMSANTKRLAELCAGTGTETHQIETAKEIDAGWFKGKGRAGVTAGASTPEWVVEEVKGLLRAL